MNRVSKVERLKEVEKYIKILENNLVGVESSYFKKGSVSMDIDTDDFNFNGTDSDEEIEFTKQVMVDFIKNQLKQHKSESKQILQDLIEE